MTRATAAEVLKLYGGTYPVGLNATNIGNLLDPADYVLDAFVKKYYEASLSTTGTAEVHIANKVAVQLGLRAVWMQRFPDTTQPIPPIFTEEIKALIEALVAETTDGPSTTVDTIDTDAIW